MQMAPGKSGQAMPLRSAAELNCACRAWQRACGVTFDLAQVGKVPTPVRGLGLGSDPEPVNLI